MKTFIYLMLLIYVSPYSIAQESERSICSDSTMEDFEKSIIYYSEKIAKDSSDHSACYSIGMSYYKLKDFAKAIRYFDSLIQLNPGYKGTYANRGMIRLFMKQTSEAACSDFIQNLRYRFNPKAINGMTLRKWSRQNCNSAGDMN